MQIDTIVRTAKVVQAVSLFTVIGVTAYCTKKQKELDTLIATGETKIKLDTMQMRLAEDAITRKS